MSKNCLVYVTVKNKNEGIFLSKLVVKKKLAACVNLFPKVQSIFEWDKELKIEDESVLIFKTTEKKYHELENFISTNHSYETPCILKLKIQEGKKTFLDWIEKTTSEN